MRAALRRERGVSLVEAMVAFAVMALGMLAVVGMQATLRTNADLARQRAEAVRLAQDAIEEWRGITSTNPTTTTPPTVTSYVNIVTQPDEAVTNIPLPSGDPTPLNTTYTIKRTVNDEPVVDGATAAARKLLVVDVSWNDRNSESQYVRLSSTLAWMDPALEASIVLTSNPERVLRFGSRNRVIPLTAKNLGLGRSGWVPPGQSPTATSTVAWVFNNTTGLITVCQTPATTTDTLDATYINNNFGNICGTAALLVTGFLRYDGTAPPTVTSVVNPTNSLYIPNLPVTVEVTDGPSVPCYTDTSLVAAVAYYCAVPVGNAVTPTWSGALKFWDSPSSVPVALQAHLATATSALADLPGLFKVCRYPSVSLSYTNQTTPLVNQNFVFITAGDGTRFYPCPHLALDELQPVSDYQPITSP